jgi:hypothetical protein
MNRRGRKARATAFGIAAVVLSAGVASSADAFSWANFGTIGHAGNRLIRTPHRGDRLPSRPVLIKVHAGKRVEHFRVQLNGNEIGAQFSEPTDRGVRRLVAGSPQGLRHGRNRLHARADDRRKSIRFRVRHGRALGGGFGGGGPGTPAHSPPAVPVDTMTFENGSGASGIKVGDNFYPSDPFPGGRLPWAQVVALHRDTLEPAVVKDDNDDPIFEGNSTIGCDDEAANCPEAQEELRDDLAALGPSTLVIVSAPMPSSGNCSDVAIPAGLEAALSGMGVSSTGFDQQTDSHSCGAISAIGIPGITPGEADWHAVAKQPGGGRMQGSLILDNELKYTFESYDRVELDTQAQGSTDSQNVIQVGDKTYKQSFSGGIHDGGGFQVIVLDAQTLAPTSPPQWFETDQSDKSALIGQLTAMRNLIHGANAADAQHRKLVLIASLGSPAIQYYARNHITAPDDQINTALSGLVDEVEQAGGTRNAFYSMLDPGLYKKNSYSLLAAGNSGPGQGAEEFGKGISGNGTGPLNTTPIAGQLARTGRNWAFELQGSPRIEQSGADLQLATSQLTDVAFQKPSRWPETDPDLFPTAAERTRKQNAIKWIGLHTSLKTEYPRDQYWSHKYLQSGDFDEQFWRDWAHEVQAKAYPGDGLGFNSDDFQWAKDELAGSDPSKPGGEVGWLIQTFKFLGGIAEPFGQSAQNNWSILQARADEINNNEDLKSDKDATTYATTSTIFKVINVGRNLLGLTPEVGEVFSALNEAFDAGVELVELANGEPASADFKPSVGQMGNALATRLTEAQTVLSKRLPEMISADYLKLKTIGACASDEDACPFNTNNWAYGNREQQAASNALVKATDVWAYGQLLPTKYTVFKLAPWWRTKVDGVHFFNHTFYEGVQRLYPFDGLPDSAQFAAPLYRNIPSYSHELYRDADDVWHVRGDTWRVSALGRLANHGTGTDPWVMRFPGSATTNKLFGPTASGGYGLDPETFFDTQFDGPGQTQAFKKYPTPAEPVGWCGFDGGVCDQ